MMSGEMCPVCDGDLVYNSKPPGYWCPECDTFLKVEEVEQEANND